MHFSDQPLSQGAGGLEVYSYIGFWPSLQHHLIGVHFYEGGKFLLVNAKTGEVTAVPAIPIANADGSRFAIPMNHFESPNLEIRFWRVDADTEPLIRPHKLVSIPYPEIGTDGDLFAAWIDNDRFITKFTPADHQITDEIIVDFTTADAATINGRDIRVTFNGARANRSAVKIDISRLGRSSGSNDPIRAIDRLAVSKRIYADRDYIFTRVPSILHGQPYLVFNNSNMHATLSEYATFHLYRPATLYIAIDEQACELPGWMADWMPVDETITTTDIGMKLYKKAFPEGDVTLGGNEAPPAACIRSHYLLFVQQSEDIVE